MTSDTWNARGELTGMTRAGLTASFAYDAFGRRISKTVNGTTTKFLYDGGDAVQEQNASGAPTANMLVGGTDTVFSRTEGASTRTFQHDGLGSAIGLLDQNGATTTSYAYEPFGATNQSGAANGNASKYTGREDDGTGLYYYRARYYSPTLQRFISEDPIGFAGGDVNLYGYVGNDPINKSDSSGLYPDDDINSFGPLKLYGGWRARVDPFNEGGQSSFEIHVYGPEAARLGKVDGERGIIKGFDGWVGKHGKAASPPAGIPPETLNQLNGFNVDNLRRRHLLPPKDQAINHNIKRGSYVRPGHRMYGALGFLGLFSGLLNDYDNWQTAARKGKSYDKYMRDIDCGRGYTWIAGLAVPVGNLGIQCVEA